MTQTILVTGGSGFIGSHLCSRLLEAGAHVVCIDNLTTGAKQNIELLSSENFTFVKGNVSDPQIFSQLDQFTFDQIYHMASPASVTYITDHPVSAADANSIGTKNMLELAKKHGAKLLFASSSEAYGDPKEHPQKETYWGNVNPVGVRSGYDEGKRFGEAYCMAYHREFGVDVKIIRIFNTYGPHSSPIDSRVVPRLVTLALKNEPLTIHGDGSQTRSFCYVTDLVDGIVRMMNSDQTGPINLGSPEELTINEVAKLVIRLARSNSSIVFSDRPQDDPGRRKPDISKAKEVLDWAPQVAFEDGLKKTIEYFKVILDNNLRNG